MAFYIHAAEENMFIVFSVNVMIINEPFSGTIHSNERPLHEERPRLRPRLLHHGTVHVQRPAGPQRTDPQSQGSSFLCLTMTRTSLCS